MLIGNVSLFTQSLQKEFRKYFAEDMLRNVKWSAEPQQIIQNIIKSYNQVSLDLLNFYMKRIKDQYSSKSFFSRKEGACSARNSRSSFDSLENIPQIPLFKPQATPVRQESSSNTTSRGVTEFKANVVDLSLKIPPPQKPQEKNASNLTRTQRPGQNDWADLSPDLHLVRELGMNQIKKILNQVEMNYAKKLREQRSRTASSKVSVNQSLNNSFQEDDVPYPQPYPKTKTVFCSLLFS